ncbi:hypothetical protein [Paenibacillus sp. SYP-B4298]|uniref:hypothetical protein n=1 Tax=Paenibacillus sp. SYP-B4298 TaxID=2996034 RepID=UPI0022DD2430|nr:hypothetical protein [Paenibacillus sp. SYP-B4298]
MSIVQWIIRYFTELRNLFNEWFVRDTSRKVKSGYHQRALNGDYTGAFAPYGYPKDEQNKHKLVPDGNVAFSFYSRKLQCEQ